MTKKNFLLLFLLALPNLAFAYIDPGTGAYFIQMILALIGAGIFYITHPRKLASLLIEKWMSIIKWLKVKISSKKS